MHFAVVYSPKNQVLDELVSSLRSKMNLVYHHPFRNAAEMDDYLLNGNLSKLILCGIQFEDELADAVKLPSTVNVTLR